MLYYMTHSRDILKTVLQDEGQPSQSELSRLVGKNRTYITNFLAGRAPKELPPEIALKVAKILHIDVNKLLDDKMLPLLTEKRSLSNFQEDAEQYIPPKNDILSGILGDINIIPYKIKTRALDALGILPGQVHLFDFSAAALRCVKVGDVVIAQVFDPNNNNKQAYTIMRQFIPPRKLITNSITSDLKPIDIIEDDAFIRGLMKEGKGNKLS